MARVNVYLPDDLEAQMRAAGLSASEVLQEAVRQRLEEQERLAAMEQYLADGLAEHGPPTEEDLAWVEERLAPLREREARKAS